MENKKPSFKESLDAGSCSWEDIYDYIEEWHTRDEVGELKLYEYLGMSLEEYTAWIEKGNKS
jgi:hypothetical protein